MNKTMIVRSCLGSNTRLSLIPVKIMKPWTPFISLVVLLALMCARSQAQEGTEVPNPTLPPGYMLIEGDILVPIPPGHAPKGTYQPSPTSYWTDGVVPYVFNANVTAANRTNAIRAMAEWSAVASIRFVARSNQDNYLSIQDSDVNSSQVGMVGGSQTVNIFNWNMRFIIAHEVGHALGFWHEQSRSDRDTFVQINWGNIQAGKAHNFNRHDEASHYGPYDFDSVMHYGQDSFSTNGLPTITVLPPNQAWQNLIGQRDHFSTSDAMIMSYLYPRSDWRFVDRNFAGTENGTFLEPFKTITNATADLPAGGKMIVLQPGNYPAAGTIRKAMTIVAPLGGVVLK